ncbi:fungal pheromone mating factor STE2 GPCR-domain-containing protein [Scheffersomyces coipomensis]|uniref:fungal pheromone mating factor STE2 GPCR-domain-containing protein n=1 Tax=Scheffersomyces coipomensis TaxID=1788519 RepID=UPI00315C93D6
MNIFVSPNVDSQSIFLNFTLPQDPSQQVFELPFGLVDAYFHRILQQTIVHGVSIGACVVLIITLLIFPNKHKNNPMFYMNLMSLIWMIIRAGLNIAFILSPLNSPSFSFTGLLNPETSSYTISTVANSSEVILVVFILLSINYQIYIIFKSPEVKIMKFISIAISAGLSLATIGLYMNSTIRNNQMYHQIFTDSITSETVINGMLVNDLPRILFYTVINVTSLILVFKLVMAIKTRRYLGLKQFDSFHVLLIMSSQTLIIPTILVFVHYGLGESSSSLLLLIGLLLVVLSLPVTSLWASSANNKSNLPLQLPKDSLSFLARFSTNGSSSSSDNDNDTMIGSTVYSMFPEKLSKYHSGSSNGSSETQVGMTPNSHTTAFRNQLPPELAEILNENDDDEISFSNQHQTINTPGSQESSVTHEEQTSNIDHYLNNISDDELRAVTKHNINV